MADKKDPIDVVISFDTTGSMYPCLTQVRRQVEDLVNRLIKDIKGIRIGIIAHGDYCDAGNPYVLTMLDLTTDKNKLCTFIREIEPTYGGDAPECYELVLNQARKASWKSKRSKVLVMIGDDVPHPPSYRDNKGNLDWENEAGLLKEAGVNVYSVQALGRRHSTSFYKKLARITDGYYLPLNQFRQIRDLILAVCYKQKGDLALKDFEAELISVGRMSRDTDQIIGTMLGRDRSIRYVDDVTDLGAVLDGRFQVIEVDEDTPIKEFVEENGLTFKKGRGFYEFTKRVKVQDYKEVILQDVSTGDLFSGDKARELAGIPIGCTASVSPGDLGDYRCFIQSTSVNRKLLGGTLFLYEVADFAE